MPEEMFSETVSPFIKHITPLYYSLVILRRKKFVFMFVEDNHYIPSKMHKKLAIEWKIQSLLLFKMMDFSHQ